MMLSTRNDWHAAAEHLGIIASRSREIRSPNDPDLALQLYNWAASLQNAGDNAAAEPILRDVLRLVDEHGLDREDFAPAARNGLAKALEARGEYEEADELFQAALAARRRRYGSAHREIAYSLSDYGEAMLDRDDVEGAEPLLAELVRMQARLLGPDDWQIASARYLYGRCLAKLGRYAEAETQLLPACETMARSPDALANAARSTRAGILELYSAWDAAEPGQGLAARAERWQEKFPAE